MTNANTARRAHDVLDGLFSGRILSRENEQLLRCFLPELPKQMTLEEIVEHVRNAWVGASGNEWAGNSCNREIALESWLGELYVQLQGLKGTPAAEPENVAVTGHSLPAGMRIAEHVNFGRVVVSPEVGIDKCHEIFYLDPGMASGTDISEVEPESLTFIDAKPAHPEFLETEADYQNAPEGTIVACDDSPPCHKFGSGWSSVLFYGMKDDRGMSRAIRRVLRWGWGE